MRIVTVLTSLGIGGAERHALAVAERMAKRGHSVAVLVLRSHLAEQWPTSLSTVHLDLRKSPLGFFYAILRARRLLREFKPDVVHSHSFHANIFARLLKFVVPSAPVVSTVHNVYEGGQARMLAYRFTGFLSRCTVAVSQAAAERFIRLKAIPAGKCRVLTNGIDTAEFTPDGERRAATRLAMDANSHFVWFTAGRLVQAKDFPNLLEAFRQVRRQLPETELWIAGASADARVNRQNEKYRAVWRTAMERGLQDHVCWLGLRRDIPALLDAADAFVMASAWEGMPLAAGEAMAMEKPVVVTDAGGARELVADAGFVVEAKNPAALAEAMIATMQQSRESLAALGRRARRRIQQEFELSAVVDSWEALYRELIG